MFSEGFFVFFFLKGHLSSHLLIVLYLPILFPEKESTQRDTLLFNISCFFSHPSSSYKRVHKKESTQRDTLLFNISCFFSHPSSSYKRVHKKDRDGRGKKNSAPEQAICRVPQSRLFLGPFPGRSPYQLSP